MARAMLVVIGLGLGLGFGCKRDAPTAPTHDESASSSSSASVSASSSVSVSVSGSATAPHVAVGTLPVCAESDDPLSAICALGADASKARFECAKPEPTVFCGAVDEWDCRTVGDPAPRVTFRASFDHVGAKIEEGEVIDPKKFARKGPVRVVGVSTQVKDDAEGNALVDDLRATFVKWGCVLRSGDVTARFDCGEWEAKVGYSDIAHRVRVDAAMKGFGECGGA